MRRLLVCPSAKAGSAVSAVSTDRPVRTRSDGRQVVEQAALTDAWLADDGDKNSTVVVRDRQCVFKTRDFLAAADERCHPNSRFPNP
jgi:hypothetical protein